MKYLYVLPFVLILSIYACRNSNEKNCNFDYLQEYAVGYSYDTKYPYNKNLPLNFCDKIKLLYECDSVATLKYLNLILLKMNTGHLLGREMGGTIMPLYRKKGGPDFLTTLNDNNCIFYYTVKSAGALNDEHVLSDIVHSNIENDSLLKNDRFIKKELINNEGVRRSIDSIYDLLERQLKE